ncbi:9111_t:CDS:2 [Cetraspora pellucida]|uniref:9111_t:CDS:1 n=1 Tax=Cetraspora pellucida TaxID=1433469 RepID=A0ACA9LXI2_9GLOM|nr:9111_t:CDS:2 [Cetraspora pellucida]
MDPLMFTAPARIRILLVPVHPIKAATFHQKVELVKNYTIVKLGDVPPDMRGGQYATICGTFLSILVIGIMDCCEWTNLNDGYKKFMDIYKNYSSSVAYRCFAFDPAENQPDDTKGLIMFPNDGKIGFYMSTMISDFTSNILTEFGALASSIERKSIIHSPKIPASNVTSTNGSLPQNGRYSSPTNSYSSPDLKSVQISTMPLTPPSQAMTTAGLGGTTAGVNLKDNPLHGRSFSASTLVNIPSDMKLKRRAQGRVYKLIADLFLMAGRLPDAVQK